jgi:hypothetical protein
MENVFEAPLFRIDIRPIDRFKTIVPKQWITPVFAGPPEEIPASSRTYHSIRDRVTKQVDTSAWLDWSERWVANVSCPWADACDPAIREHIARSIDSSPWGDRPR